jgi:hypothetical protein
MIGRPDVKSNYNPIELARYLNQYLLKIWQHINTEAARKVNVVCAFGGAPATEANTTVTGQTWVTASSVIVTQVLTPAGGDPDTVNALALKVQISAIVVGVGFTVSLYCAAGTTGDYTVMCLGAP